jgi:hypothetical protein
MVEYDQQLPKLFLLGVPRGRRRTTKFLISNPNPPPPPPKKKTGSCFQCRKETEEAAAAAAQNKIGSFKVLHFDELLLQYQDLYLTLQTKNF